MAIRDTLTTFADGVASGNVGTRVIGDVIDLKGLGDTTNVGTNLAAAVADIGQGQDIRLVITVDEDYVGGGTTDSISFALVTSDLPGLTNGVTLLSTGTFTYGAGTDVLDAGDVVVDVSLPVATYLRYIGIVETVSAVITTGAINAGLQTDPFTTTKTYPQADVAFP